MTKSQKERLIYEICRLYYNGEDLNEIQDLMSNTYNINKSIVEQIINEFEQNDFMIVVDKFRNKELIKK